MASPIKPSQLKALTGTEEERIGTRIVKFLKFMVLFVRWYQYVYQSDGTFTAAFKADLCKLDCTTTTT